MLFRSVMGLSDPDGVSLQISNMVRDAIKPDVTMFLHYETMEVDGREIVAVDIQRGTDRPYYLAKKGMRPEGVYVRQGYSSVPATDTAIRYMIKETDGDRFEAMRCLNQELTFESVRKEFELRKVEFGPQQMRTLKLMDSDDLYSNLGLLLSDQCVHTIKVAVFQGTDQAVFKDRREFTGSLMRQMNEVYDFIDFRNQTRATIEKLLRTDVRDYPEIAVREALLNLIVHRDYSFSASALISIYTDRIEFVSIGGLVPGIDLEDIMVGISVCRNQDLANVFYRLHLIEAYGTGMGKIMNAYRDMEEKPRIETTRNAFKIVLPVLKSFPQPLTAAEERYYMQKYTEGDLEAKHILIERNLRLVAHIVKKYQTSPDDTEDLLSIGTIGLIKAVVTFDPDKSVRLGTYAARCIENELLMHLRAKKKTSREVSLYDPIGTDREGNEIQLFDIIETEEDDAHRKIELKDDIQTLYQRVEAALSPRERLVLKMRYGLYNEEEYTQREIADFLGISRSYVSRIEKSAIEKLREYF